MMMHGFMNVKYISVLQSKVNSAKSHHVKQFRVGCLWTATLKDVQFCRMPCLLYPATNVGDTTLH